MCQCLCGAVLQVGLERSDASWAAVANEAAAVLDRAAKNLHNVEWKVGRQEWRELLEESLSSGGGLIHSLSEKVDAVMGHVVKPDGSLSFDPLAELEHETAAWSTQRLAREGDDGQRLRNDLA